MDRPSPLTAKDADSARSLLLKCEMFFRCKPDQIDAIIKRMKTRILRKNEALQRQGDPCDRFFLLEDGDIRRTVVDHESGRQHNVEFAIKAKSINSMRVISGDTLHNTVKCVSDKCKLYEMRRDTFLKLLKDKPDVAVQIAEGLSEALRTGSKKYQTPLLEQTQQEINVPAVAIAAGIESYYRSALNAMLNARLTGVQAELFPNMHIQVPVRIAYITGFKGLRALLDRRVEPDQWEYPQIVRLAMAVSPGIVMTPISSILEATNAGHMNSEPMATRWMRGAVPRAGREVIFGIGLNQLSDYFEERLEPYMPGQSTMLANATGSLLAGVVSGYLSHVPHNMSTYKLLEPHKTYTDLYSSFVDKSVPPVIDAITESWPSAARTFSRYCTATLFPRGLVIRTTQIVGSFIILNGTINFLQHREHLKIQRAIGYI